MGFRSCGSRALERRLSSCGSRAQLLRGMWDLPGPGLEPASSVLAGRFLTTAPPGKPWNLFLIKCKEALLNFLIFRKLFLSSCPTHGHATFAPPDLS